MNAGADRDGEAFSRSEQGGAQGLERGLRVLRDIAASGPWGRRLIDIQAGTALTRSTAHRIAQTLVRHDFVRYDRSSRRYFVGAEIAILSASAPAEMTELPDLARATLRELARGSGDTAYLMVRSGNDTVCLARELGPYPIKALTGEIGTRRPLGVGAAGVALLASLPESECDAIRRSNRSRMRRYPRATERALSEALSAARDSGIAFSEGLVIEPVRGIGRVVRDAAGRPIAALSVGATRERMTEEHRAATIDLLLKACMALERRLARRPVIIDQS
jgi:DNA-binding IclR family transcriptional regulator